MTPTDPAERWWSEHEVPSKPAAPRGAYVPVVVQGDLAYVSGQLPFREGKLSAEGLVDEEVGLPQAQAAARQCALNALAALRAEIGSLARVRQVLRVGVYVASSPRFTSQPLVANGASELFQEVLGERGRHSRVALGASRLPLNSPVEVEVLAALGPLPAP